MVSIISTVISPVTHEYYFLENPTKIHEYTKKKHFMGTKLSSLILAPGSTFREQIIPKVKVGL